MVRFVAKNSVSRECLLDNCLASKCYEQVIIYIKHERSCLTTFPNTNKRAENTMGSRSIF